MSRGRASLSALGQDVPHPPRRSLGRAAWIGTRLRLFVAGSARIDVYACRGFDRARVSPRTPRTGSLSG